MSIKDQLDSANFDAEQEICDILQIEIWKEITAETGKTKEDLDNETIKQIIKINNENK